MKKYFLNEQDLSETKKRRKKRSTSTTYTTGNQAFNVKKFNAALGTDFNNPSTEEAKARAAAETAAKNLGSFAAASPDGSNSVGDIGSSEGLGASSGEGGGMSESYMRLEEAKRQVKRYLIRPQNIYCASKKDIIKALIEISDKNENCSVYTLKNLEDNEEIQKLTSKDIIYYYDEGILYDKNHVKVMDYDLYIKHEEKRKKFSKDAEDVPEREFKNEYDDRLTAKTFEEDFDYTDNELDLDFDDVDAYDEVQKDGKTVDGICCICGEKYSGYGNNPYPYKTSGKCCDSCNLHYVIPERLKS